MTIQELEAFLHQEIPVSKALGVKVIRSDEHGAEVWAPLSINENHLGTAFGGSLGAVLITSCYSWFFHQLKVRGFDTHVVVKSARTDYLLPVESDFSAICEAPQGEVFDSFFAHLKRKGRGRLTLKARIYQKGQVACLFEGEFVALTSME